MTSKINTAVWLAGFALLAVAIGGCTKSQQNDAQTTTAPVSQPAAPAAAPAVGATTQPQSAATAAAATSSAGVASGDGDQAGTKFVVDSLARGSDVLTLKFTLVNGPAAPLQVGGRFGGSGYTNNYRDMSGVHLIDTVSKKKYFPLADTEKNCVCSHDVNDVTPSSQTALWVKFPAPPPTVTKITVEAPHFIPLDNVPITQ